MRLALIALVLAAGTAHADPSSSAADVLGKVTTYYKSIGHLKGEFHQEVVYKDFGTTKKSHGTIELARPRKFRLDYAKSLGAGTKRSFRSDGTHLWDVDRDNLEIMKKDLATDVTPAAVGVLTGADVKKDYTPSLATSSGFGGSGDVVVQLDAKQPNAGAKQVFIVVDPKDGRVKETAVVDSSGNVDHIVYDKLDGGAAVKASDFVVDVDSKEFKTYKIVDADAKPRTDRDK